MSVQILQAGIRGLRFNRKNAQGGQTGENPVADLIPKEGGQGGRLGGKSLEITEGFSESAGVKEDL